MKEDEDSKKCRKCVEEELTKKNEKGEPVIKIDSEFIARYFGKMSQAKLALKALNPFEDALLMNGLCGIDCTKLDFSHLTQEDWKEFFAKVPFDSATKFPKEIEDRFQPQEILRRGQNFGCGLGTSLTASLTGEGVHIAIRDENCNPNLISDNIVDYTYKNEKRRNI